MFLSSTTPSSISLLPIPLELSRRTLNVLASLICSADGAGVGDCEGVIAGSLRPSRGRRSNLDFSDTVLHLIKSPEHFACTHPECMLHW